MRRRLKNTRWPEPATEESWAQGVPLTRLKALVDYWRTDYDWRRCEKRLNGLGQFRTEIGGLDFHFLHVRSPHAEALPLIITHGWPGSVIEFLKVIGPLTNPEAHGGKARDAFHVVAPSLPGFGFSGKPTARGWNAERIARAWAELMQRLGYGRYVAQGGDWGAVVTMHCCVEGWTAIGKWKGVPLRDLLEAVRLMPRAHYIVFHCADDFDGRPYCESIDLNDAFHPQTILAYALNDAPLSIGHGAPVRLRVERQLGYKHAKYVMEVEAVASLAGIGQGKGGYWEDAAGYN